jgi:hypothetical protein
MASGSKAANTQLRARSDHETIVRFSEVITGKGEQDFLFVE